MIVIKERSLQPKEPRWVCCPDCGGEIYEGEAMYLFRFGAGRKILTGGAERYICGRCLVKEVSELKPEEIAWLAGIKDKKVSFSFDARSEVML